MLGFLFGYLLGSPSITIRSEEKERKRYVSPKERRDMAACSKHSRTCPYCRPSEKSEMESIFY